MSYHVVFDASRNGSQLVVCLLVSILALLPGLLGWSLMNSGKPEAELRGKFYVFVSVCAFAFSALFFLSEYAEFHEAKKALETGNYQTVEGTVTDFVPLPPGGHATESFKVGGTSFRYGSGWGSVIFNADWNHGYIRNGTHVRIAYQREKILRIEVR